MTKARHILTMLLCCLAFFYSQGQKNLILNGGMEDTLYCDVSGANNIQQFRYWYCPTAASSFAYHKCVYYNPGAPGPHSGYGCTSPGSYYGPSSSIPDCMQYVAGKFSKSLEAGKKYCFSMYIKLYRYCQYGSNNVGLFIASNTFTFNTQSVVLSVAPVLTIPFTVTDTNWVEFKGTFIAAGGETDFMVGGYMPYTSANYPLIYPTHQAALSVLVYDDLSLTGDESPKLIPDKTICAQNDSVLLGDSAWIGVKYKWFENGVLIDTLQSQIKVKPSSTTTYILTQENCEFTSDTVTINVIDDCTKLSTEMIVPNVFTPNGDGQNDTFKVSFEGATNLTGTFYNRWGNIVYKSDLRNASVLIWDGRTTSGMPCNDGTYFFVISYTDPLNVNKQVKGYITLLR